MDYNKPQGVIRNDAAFQKQSNTASYTAEPSGNQMKNPYNSGASYNPPAQVIFDQASNLKGTNKGYSQVNTDQLAENDSEFTGLFDLKRSGHPVAGIFHMAFKALAIFL